jgi:basic amino acid/polyamine antiporter, APA family
MEHTFIAGGATRAASAPPQPSLRRSLGPWDLTAIGINQVIGGAIFLAPAQVAAHVGGWSPLAVLLVGVTTLLVAACFAEVGSRFDTTGGAYVYTRAAFGRFLGFEVGWLQWFTRVTSFASIVNGIALAAGFYFPAVVSGAPRAALIVTLTGALTFVNVRGIRQSAWLVNTLTVAKLLPLIGFVIVGLWAFDPQLYPSLTPVAAGDLAAAALLLVFTFGGFDVVGVPAGESKDPRRDVPFAYFATVAVVTLVFLLIHVALLGTHPALASARTPIADAALRVAGPTAALVVAIGAVVSMTGNNAGQILSGSRMLFALAEGGELPPWLARVHPRYRTPANAIAFTVIVAVVLALSGSFAKLAAVSAVSRLLAYAGTAAATIRLRYLDRAGEQRPTLGASEPSEDPFLTRRATPVFAPARFRLPLGRTIPLLALASSLVILVGATAEQLAGGALALVAGAALFAIARGSRHSL